MPLTAGTRLGPYEILAFIGAGGMGEVYKARDTRLKRLVALKLLLADKMGNPDRRERFVQEAQAASALNHPNIITIYDTGHENGQDYIVMEYIAGKSLDQIIPRNGMRAGAALKYALPMADALAAAHAAGIVHRDFKPANVMVREDDVVKVLDFGLAKLMGEAETSKREDTQTLHSATRDGLIMGTVAYMSPEQAEGRPVDARGDIFSFGSVL